MDRLTIPLPTGVACASPDVMFVERGEGYTLACFSHLAVFRSCTDGQLYHNEHDSWLPSGWNDLAGPLLRTPIDRRRMTADDSTVDDVARHHGSWINSVVDEVDDSGVLVGALEDGHPRVHADGDHLTAFDGNRPALWLLAWGSEVLVFDAYMRFLSGHAHTPGCAPRVWCSWYSYYEKVSWDVPLGQLPGFVQPGFDTLQIDDGWQRDVGDWRANEKFGEDLGACTSDIAALGATPGVRVAPFIARPDTPFLTKHLEAFVHVLSGELAVTGYDQGSPCCVFDTTRPPVQEYLRDFARSLVNAGIGYVRADFVNAATIDGVRYEAGVTRGDACVIGSRLLRGALEDGVYLPGSSVFIIPPIDIHDGIRVGCDAALIWKNYMAEDRPDAEARNTFVISVARPRLRPLIDCDFDVVFLRHMKSLSGDRKVS